MRRLLHARALRESCGTCCGSRLSGSVGSSVPTSPFPILVALLKLKKISQLARRSTHLNQRSGVSVRLSIANYETLVASACGGP